MVNQKKFIFSLILAAVAVSMGIAVIVLTIINNDISIVEYVRLLAIGVTALGLLAISKYPKEDKNEK